MLLVRCRCSYWRLFLPGGLCQAGGPGGAERSLALVGPCRVTQARSWLGRSQGNIAGWGAAYLGTCENRAEAGKHPSPPPAISLHRVLCPSGRPLCLCCCFGSFLGLSYLLHANLAPHRRGGTRSRVTAHQGVIAGLGRGF